MARRRFLVCYDIRHPVRLRNVAAHMEANGLRVQYSVFVCDLSRAEFIAMRAGLEKLMKLTEDSVMVVDLGDADLERFTFIGYRWRVPADSGEPVII